MLYNEIKRIILLVFEFCVVLKVGYGTPCTHEPMHPRTTKTRECYFVCLSEIMSRPVVVETKVFSSQLHLWKLKLRAYLCRYVLRILRTQVSWSECIVEYIMYLSCARVQCCKIRVMSCMYVVCVWFDCGCFWRCDIPTAIRRVLCTIVIWDVL